MIDVTHLFIFAFIESSLGWESWEQFCVWKLIAAHNVPVENYVAILPKLDPKGKLVFTYIAL